MYWRRPVGPRRRQPKGNAKQLSDDAYPGSCGFWSASPTRCCNEDRLLGGDRQTAKAPLGPLGADRKAGSCGSTVGPWGSAYLSPSEVSVPSSAQDRSASLIAKPVAISSDQRSASLIAVVAASLRGASGFANQFLRSRGPQKATRRRQLREGPLLWSGGIRPPKNKGPEFSQLMT